MKIDLTNWPKVEGKTFPADGHYLCAFSDGSYRLHEKKAGEEVPSGFDAKAIHYGPIEFVSPKVIPLKPELQLHLIETKDGLAWCLDRCDSWFPVHGLTTPTCRLYLKSDCKVIET
jgi:hypothetical protein